MSYVCREGHYHEGRRPDNTRCPEERVSDLVLRGVGYEEAVERVYDDPQEREGEVT